MRLLLGVVLVLLGCSGNDQFEDNPVKVKTPFWFPEVVYPPDNAPTKARIELGRRFFFSKDLSADGKTSCASCHVSSSAFTDGKKVSTGAHGKPGKRNAPTLANLMWMPYYMMEGGVPTLEMQVLAPMMDSLEMGIDFNELSAMLNKNNHIVALSKAAYGRPVDAYVITRALACYERTFISADSRYDRAFFLKQEKEMNAEERAGMELFFSKRTQCSSCHSGVFFSDFDFHNIGLYEHYEDPGKERESYQPGDSGKFKTPTLRNIELSAPYMHDGSIGTLEEVIAFYNTGGRNNALKDKRIRPIGLNKEEEMALLAFLKCLTDWNFVQNASFLPLE